MLTSIRVWGHCMALKPSGTQKFCDDFLTAYIQALAAGKAYWIERETAHGLVAQLLGDLRGRERADFLDHRTVLKGKRRHLLLDGKRALPASAAEREQVSHWLAEFAQSQPNPGFFKVLDLARRVAGTGSLGLARYVILVQGKGSPERNYLLDLKQSVASSLAPTLKAAKIAQPAWASQAHRVVAVQRRLQAVSAAFLQPVQMNHHAYVLRGLQPSEDRVTVDLATHSQGDVSRLLADMGHLLAWAQLRSAGRQGSAWADELIAFAGRKKMPAKLLDASQDLAEQALSDAQAFNAAYDDKALA
jgi:uncharacterized protein (DUF2252 family)